ncbi:MAG: HD domain-containing phosphohydrolase [Pseudomonadota bacterium]
MGEKVLFVDDEENLLAAMARQFRRKFEIHTANNGAQGLAMLESDGPFEVVVSDMRMPEMNGLQFFAKAKLKAPESVRIMLTGNADQETVVKAINEGSIFRFYTKPCPPEQLEDGIRAGIRQYQLVNAERLLLDRTLAASVKVLVDVLSMLEPGIFGRLTRTRQWARAIAQAAGQKYSWELDIAVMLAPLGHLALPMEVQAKLREGQSLSPTEKEMLDHAPETARNLVANIPRLEEVAGHVHYQRKGYDGSGFPNDEVKGADIPFGARLLRLVNDLSDAVTSQGSFRSAFRALDEGAKVYDPALLQAARNLYSPAEGAPRGEPPRETIKVGVAQLRPGDRMLSDLRTKDGTLLLARDMDISQFDIERLLHKRRILEVSEPFFITRQKENKPAAF